MAFSYKFGHLSYIKLAEIIACQILAGQILALSGPVGAGKTTFVKAFAAALGVSETVVSPTYTLLQPYNLPNAINGVEKLIHIDAYRLESAAELRAIGFDDFVNDSRAVIVIEWAENIGELLVGRDVQWIDFLFENGRREVVVR